MKSKYTGFTMMELLTAILIVTILAAASIPLMRGKIDSSKWAEANAAAGIIRNAVKVYFVETGDVITGNLNDTSIQQSLEIQAGDLTGTYFIASDYQIDSVNSDGIAAITVKASQTNAPSGSKTLAADGTWQ